MIIVDLKRQDDGVVIGTAQINEALCYSEIIESPGGTENVLSFLSVNDDKIQFNDTLTFISAFDVYVTTSEALESSSYVPLFGGTSASNRVLLSGLQNKLAINIGGSSINYTTVNVDMALKNKIRLYRDLSNDIYIQINDEAPVFCMNNTNAFEIKYIGRTQSRKFNGNVHGFGFGNSIFDLNEESGTVLTSLDSLIVGEILTTQSTTYVNNNIWSTSGTPVASIEVINLGVGGDNSQDLLNRVTEVTNLNPDLTIVGVLINDSINSSKIISHTQFKTKLTNIVQPIIANGSDVIIMNMTPVIDSYKKDDHDYTPYYGDESLFDLNIDILPLFRTAVQEVCTEQGCVMADTLAPFTAHGEPQITLDSYLRNALNAGGETDGVHPTTIGYGVIANTLIPLCTGYNKIVCFGDSITLGVGGTPYPLQLSQSLNS